MCWQWSVVEGNIIMPSISFYLSSISSIFYVSIIIDKSLIGNLRAYSQPKRETCHIHL